MCRSGKTRSGLPNCLGGLFLSLHEKRIRKWMNERQKRWRGIEVFNFFKTRDVCATFLRFFSAVKRIEWVSDPFLPSILRIRKRLSPPPFSFRPPPLNPPKTISPWLTDGHQIANQSHHHFFLFSLLSVSHLHNRSVGRLLLWPIIAAVAATCVSSAITWREGFVHSSTMLSWADFAKATIRI